MIHLGVLFIKIDTVQERLLCRDDKRYTLSAKFKPIQPTQKYNHNTKNTILTY